ncbi:NAD(P)/FAD-dependent oxidoreductase [Ketogulonicigenium vulgare]|uniref:Pyridine nucleotide-disulfide oxidoreductase family protein n=1 Tax=Ketogulonicigenium vulgare (strain WSH-001) TaxID=759362 RepID=F9Y7S7_KETVW|nr:FAD-dependent oxidoreductase [Ketogulonicigenium vulgare]ADO41656.1 FAD-dependent pyridine nucleotide-disulfide oxidoreductase [Ketogulonicigenium vulgare Y25]AEM39893.1 pyridine nucleotide-disulfide oxidoreductase family protein [Ketogulonicigenium vulgare WSH-001]ALJ80110.1 pyridine nucleotide-disulfide oxidoreductase [Ketogulonicigenium vulgare]ANW32980.1 pyridine nucleotide-disulfide oxidoreductase [Ketogulonicigenium vulgare]AOZ53587.1 FAD-dependent pyridine nucleotide-disulfide oxidor
MDALNHVVVIGGGQAAAALVAKLRTAGYTQAITIIGAEVDPPYQRPPLSKAYLAGEMARERLYLRPAAFYQQHNITLRTGLTVTAIDRAARRITLSDGSALDYDALALTTGADPRPLPADKGGALAGVLTMRNLADADALDPLLTAGKSLLVVGGGYIGLEAAAVAAKRGLDVTLVHSGARILSRVAAPATSDYFRALHESHGVKILEGVSVDHLLGTGHVTGAVLTDGQQVTADLVIVGIGIIPNDQLARDAGLLVENGIAVDDFGRTSDLAIYAAGDVAALVYQGVRMRIESVGNAIDQAENVALNMLGQGVPYAPKPWFWSDQYDCKLQIAGLGAASDDITIRKGEGLIQSNWYYRGGQLVAIDAMNDPRAYMVGKRLIEAGKSADPALVADPALDLKALLK